MKTWIVNAETVHNWRNRAREWAAYYDGLPAEVRLAIERAHDAHHRDGLDARDAAIALAAQYPQLEGPKV